MMKQKNIFRIIGFAFIVVVLLLVGVGFFSVISTQESFVLSQDDYVCTTCTVSATKTLGLFNESASFDFEITNSIHQDDAEIYIVGSNDEKKLLFKQYFTPTCDGYNLANNPYGPVKVLVEVDEYVFSLKNAISGEEINYVSKGTLQPPYIIEFKVVEARQSRTMCGLGNGYYKQGVISVDNIILRDTEPTVVEETPIIIEDEEVVEETPIIEDDDGNDLTGDVTATPTYLAKTPITIPLIAVFVVGLFVTILITKPFKKNKRIL